MFPGDRVVTRSGHELGSFFAKGVLTVPPEVARDIQSKVQSASMHSIAGTINIDGVIDVPPMNRSSEVHEHRLLLVDHRLVQFQ